MESNHALPILNVPPGRLRCPIAGASLFATVPKVDSQILQPARRPVGDALNGVLNHLCKFVGGAYTSIVRWSLVRHCAYYTILVLHNGVPQL